MESIFFDVCVLVTAAFVLTLVPGFRQPERSLLSRRDQVTALVVFFFLGLVEEVTLSHTGWLNERTDPSAKVEIILYDRTPGGAGFVEEGKTRWNEVIDAAIEICQPTTSHVCEKACYDCLKDFGNQSYHHKLDRKSVLQFLGIGP
jgi:Domain of unknown function (DUF1998)